MVSIAFHMQGNSSSNLFQFKLFQVPVEELKQGTGKSWLTRHGGVFYGVTYSREGVTSESLMRDKIQNNHIEYTRKGSICTSVDFRQCGSFSNH